jgi:FtsH-binding integral membrane protein
VSEQNPPSRETHGWIERELTHSRHVIANAKVVVTFSAALAATFASAASERNDKTAWDESAAWLMVATLVVTVIVIFLRSKHRPHELRGSKDPARITALVAYWLMVFRVLLSVATIVVSIIGKRHT